MSAQCPHTMIGTMLPPDQCRIALRNDFTAISGINAPENVVDTRHDMFDNLPCNIRRSSFLDNLVKKTSAT